MRTSNSSKMFTAVAVVVTSMLAVNLALAVNQNPVANPNHNANKNPHGNPNPKIIPPASTPHGLSYAQWSVKWWQWVFSQPANNNPILDTGDCSAGQSGHVWFLGGAFEQKTVTRSCKIPSGTMLFFPLTNGWADNTGCPYTTYTDEELKGFAAGFVDSAGEITATIDGVPVRG